MLERVVVVLSIVLYGNRLAQIPEFDNDLWIVFVDFDRRNVFDNGLNFIEYIRHQDGVIGREKSPRLLADGRMRNVLIVAHLLDRVDDVVRKLLGSVVG